MPTSELLYRAFTYCLHPAIPLLLRLRARRQEAYRERLSERLGIVPFSTSKPCIVIHGASLGEINGLKFFINLCCKKLTNYEIVLTCFTPAGSEQIKNLYKNSIKHCYLPLDSPQATKRFINSVKPEAIIFMETEIWPNLVHYAVKNGASLFIINGRISPKAFKSYMRFASLIKSTLQNYSLILTQSQSDTERYTTLGAASLKIKNVGNIKFDLTKANKNKHQNIDITLPKRQIWLVASSHEDEEDLFINVFKDLIKTHKEILLVIAPRHKERFSKILLKLNKAELSVKARSKGEYPDSSTQVWLIDTIGELPSFYNLATLVTVGGSFNEVGGHSVLEPGAYGVPTSVGPNMKNSQAIVSDLLAQGGLFQHQTSEAAQVSSELRMILNDELFRRELSEGMAEALTQNAGASARCLDEISQVLFDA